MADVKTIVEKLPSLKKRFREALFDSYLSHYKALNNYVG
jgi:hypothetical protein